MNSINDTKFHTGSRVIVLQPDGKLTKGVVESAIINDNNKFNDISYVVKALTTGIKGTFPETNIMVDREYYKKIMELKQRQQKEAEDNDLDYGDEDA